MFDISADRLGNTGGNPGKSVHVRRFSQRADAVKYLDELIVSGLVLNGELKKLHFDKTNAHVTLIIGDQGQLHVRWTEGGRTN